MSFKIAFDLDQTLDYGTALARLFNTLNPHVELIVLSARTSTDPTVADKLKKVEGLGIVIKPEQLHVVLGETNEARAYAKAVYCRDQQIDIFIDNNRSYCDLVKSVSPRTTILHRV
jgi:UDP-N-acetylglucosamine 2-epimerase